MEDRGDAVHVAKIPLFAKLQNTVIGSQNVSRRVHFRRCCTTVVREIDHGVTILRENKSPEGIRPGQALISSSFEVRVYGQPV